mmetsp:Transcript_35623/g.102444  ORF Transcript_35623/g.102444 Transcript_35623/m.102444 type:complete len:308 (-) Transcript_35623:444-1367(-)
MSMEVRQGLRCLPEDSADAQGVRLLLLHPRVQLPLRIEGHLQVQRVCAGVLEDGRELDNVGVAHAPQQRGLTIAHTQHGRGHGELLDHKGLPQLVDNAVHPVLRADRHELPAGKHVQRALGHPQGEEVRGQALPELGRHLGEDVPHACQRCCRALQRAVCCTCRCRRHVHVSLNVFCVPAALLGALQGASCILEGLLGVHARRLLLIEVLYERVAACVLPQRQLRVLQLHGVLADGLVHPGQHLNLRVESLELRAPRGQQLLRAPEQLARERRPELLLPGNGAGGAAQLCCQVFGRRRWSFWQERGL